jgi:uncharacterized protein (DUF58 family)
MQTSELLRKVRRIEIRTSHLVSDVLAGQFRSAFKGRGMEFEEVRPYQYGDDVRSIDWNVAARTGFPHVKLFREERELTVMLAVDLSGSLAFGSHAQLKRELAAEIAATVAFSAIRSNDRVGLVCFTDRVERYVPPRKTRSHVTRLLHELLSVVPAGRGTSLTAGLNFLNNLYRRPTLSFVLSDFHDPDTESWTRAVKSTNRRHELMALRMTDRREMELPDVGWALLQDAETGEVMEVDTSDPAVREGWAKQAAGRNAELLATFRSGRVPELEVRTDQPWAQRLQRFLDGAARRRIA